MANMSDGQVRVRVSVRARVKSRTTISGLDLGLGLRRGCPSGGDRVHARAQPRTKDKEGGLWLCKGPAQDQENGPNDGWHHQYTQS